ncbi:uncharacterized protein LOC118234297 [Anguilla anguilla]|uniref:uncharacterized protein LOC118234297 n=1 Tax=Anguilla anguilla TaxID=7936 RepID=UPI0015B20B09|nr:uncharacterized protein LOC118234297 [Anguilla anguilla]XP_035286628.1 uncharacterized protein LOC118234297 [Anguilla anguilla]
MAQSHTSYSTTREEVTSKWSDVMKNSVQIATEPKQTYLLNTAKIPDGAARRYTFGRKDPNKRKRTIMMVGEIGTGKSALINMMVNYMLGVKWEDKIRFKIIPDESKIPQTESQATVVTAYEIFGLEELSVPFSLTVIDTPGLDKDKNIAQNLYTFLESLRDVQQIDAVCLIVKASQFRLSPSQKYIFDAILSIFGKNMEKNFMILITFSDWMPPLALQLVSESGVPFLKDENNDPVHFLFNNLPLQTFAKEYEETYKKAWDNGAESFREFFQALDKLEPQSLKMTKKVLRKRCHLEEEIWNLESQIKVEEEKHKALEELQKRLEEHKEDMISNTYQNKCAAEQHATSEANRHSPWCSCIYSIWGFITSLVIATYRRIGGLMGNQYVDFPETNNSEGHQEKEDEPQYEERIRAYEDQKRLKELMESCYRSVLELEQLALKFDSGSTPQSVLRLIEMLRENKDMEKAETLQMMLKTV